MQRDKENLSCGTADILLAVILLGIAGCTSPPLPPEPPGNADFLKAFQVERVSTPLEERGRVQPLHLYIDSSESMRGFVTYPDSGYRTAIDFLLDRSATAGYPLEVFRFADGIAPLGNVAASAVLEPDFYSGDETSFPNLLQQIGEAERAGAVSVIVSDLVQSGRTGDQRALVLAFQEIAKKGRQVVLLAFRSSFSGTYFVESRRKGGPRSLRLSLDGRTADRSRPFYIILVADRATNLAEVRRYLLPDIQGNEEFDASSPALTVGGIEYLPPDLGTAAVWNVYRSAESLPAGKGHRATLSFMEIGIPSTDVTPVRLGLNLPASGPQSTGMLRSPRDLGLLVEKRTFRQGRWTPLQPADLAPEALFRSAEPAPEASAGLALTYRVPRPAASSWDVYRVRVSPGPGNLRLPDWVEDWTTPDDSLPMWGNRTLKLDLFVEAMNRSIKEKVPLSDQFILFGRGER